MKNTKQKLSPRSKVVNVTKFGVNPVKSPFKLTVKLAILLSIAVLSSFSAKPARVQDNYRVLHHDGSGILNEFLINIANEQFESRRQRVAEALSSEKGIHDYIEGIKSSYHELLNLKWHKTPLNPQVTEMIECEGSV